MKKAALFVGFLLCLGIIAMPGRLQGQTAAMADSGSVSSPPTAQLIIQFVDAAAESSLLATRASGELPQLSAAAGMPVTYVRPMSMDSHVVRVAEAMTPEAMKGIVDALAQVSGVALVEPDRILTIDSRAFTPFVPEVTPNDSRWGDMWHLRYTAGSSEGLNMVPAWDITTGSASTVVAVIDTGILAHNDLAGKTVPGYDFISDTDVSNDGDGRDNNPADPGDWCNGNPSSWHGTHVAGTIAAASNNGLGITGVNWHAKILPVRVLGTCGGYTSDIVDGMRWSAGLPVPGVPANANPAKVLNLSLGGSGACSGTQQTAINQIVAAGSTIVVAAGNSNTNVSGFNPANCNNVITVAATNRNGNRASYSNYGSLVEVSAPGGETFISSNGVLSTLDTGTTTPNNSHSYAYYQGTSMATPHVAGVASLIVGLRPGYTPAQVQSLLQTTARSFPGGSTCNTSNCGSGIVDAYRALNQLVGGTSKMVLTVLIKLVSITPNPVVNPGFESGPTGWTEFSSHGWDVIVNSGFPPGVSPHSGSWAAWLGGDYDDTSYIQQQMTIPPDTAYLRYWHWIASEDSCGWDYGRVVVNGTNVHSYDLCTSQNTNGWVQKVVNLSAYAGQNVTLRLEVETDGSLNSNLFVDDVAFQASAALAGEALPEGVELGNTAVPRSAIAP
jgi:serine protease